MGLDRTETDGGPLPLAAAEDAHTLTLPAASTEPAAAVLAALAQELAGPTDAAAAWRVDLGPATPPPGGCTLTF